MSSCPASDRNTETLRAVDATLLRRVRAQLILRGTNLSAWCHERAINPSWAAQVLAFRRNGPAAQQLRRTLCTAVGLNE